MATLRPIRPCKHPGCGNYTTNGTPYCGAHLKQVRAKTNREHYAKQGGVYDRRWRRARAAYLRLHPLCVRCGAPATDVDHIVPHHKDMTLFWDEGNWQSLCHSCHSIKTYREDGAFNNSKRDK